MKPIILALFLMSTMASAYGLVINEIMSNPIGDDSGREWVELYNNTDSGVDITSLTISVKGGAFVPVTPVSGATVIPSRGYGVIGSTVSGVTRFMQDYSLYSGPLTRSAISLVNSGVTSLDIKLGGNVVDSLSSYTAAKEGSTYSLINGSFVLGVPTPGEENKAMTTEETTPTTTETTGTQSTLPRASSPSADIILFLPLEKTVVAGAPSLFSVSSMTHAGKVINNMVYTWAFGDGGQSVGSSTLYRYFYPGRYVAQVEGTNGLIAGTGRISVRVVSPDISLSEIGSGKYGSYIDITNPSTYDLDISFWKVSINGALFSFPKNTLLISGTTRFPGAALGFASSTISSSTLIKLLFPNMDEVVRIYQQEKELEEKVISVEKKELPKVLTLKPVSAVSKKLVKVAPSSSSVSTTTKKVISLRQIEKDTRIVLFIKSFFSR